MVEALRRFKSADWILDEAYGRTPAPHVEEGEVELFHYSDSLCSQKVRVALCEKGVRWNSRFINLSTHENLRPEYVRVNPRAVVPTLIVDGVTVIDSAVITRFIDSHFAGPPLSPDTDAEKLDMEKWIEKGDHAPLRAITYRELGRMGGDLGTMMREMLVVRRSLLQRYLAENTDLVEQYTAKLQDADDYEPEIESEDAGKRDLASMNGLLDELESHLVDRQWIGGDRFNLADVIWMPNIARLKLAKLDTLWTGGRRPSIEKYWNRLKARESFRRAIRDFNTPPSSPGARVA